MKNCIYFKDNDNLSYTKGEHIMPAGLGGIKTLPLGYVSNEANEKFSRYELTALRHSILAINRNNNGPGKRGSLNVNKIRNPNILMFDAVEPQLNIDTELAPYKLGFLFSGTAYCIPQVYIGVRANGDIKLPLYLLGNIKPATENALADFHGMFYNFLSEKIRKFKIINPVKSPTERYISIGFHNDITYVSYYFPTLKLDRFFDAIANEKPKYIPVLSASVSNYHYQYTLDNFDDPSFLFIYLKTAFNTMAYLKGKEFVCNKIFDKVRSEISSPVDPYAFYVEQNLPKWLWSFVQKNVPDKSHFCVLHGHQNYVDAYTSFYNEPLTGSNRLTSEYAGEEFKCGFVCDWQQRKECVFEEINEL